MRSARLSSIIMRLVRFQDGRGAPRVGVQLRDNSIADVTIVDPQIPNCMKLILGAGQDMLSRIETAATLINRMGTQIKNYELLAPIKHPDKVLCVGMNYVDHCTEQKYPIPEVPIIFSKFSSAVCGPNDDVVLDSELTSKLDFEVELVIVIGKGGKDIPCESALEHVGGYTVAHDVSARDWQMEKNGGQWLLGKTFDTFCPLGPAIVTDLDPHNCGIRCRLNGKIVQESNTDQLIFKTEYLVNFCSRFVTLHPGDIILTGTPPGVGCFRKPPLWLKVGDHVECEIDGIGVISNNIVGKEKHR